MTFPPPPADRDVVPLDEADLLDPSVGDALATVGTLIHWVTTDPQLVAKFAAYVEHCPGDLDPGLVHRVLAATHDVLAPGCPDPIPPWAGP
jgi:hypothetical protein